ncbi:sphingosine-1-phosphate lyase [Tachypleus tridentatus]|uniref:sphingosine-1-phosphate lyase n=1 Tax=Tachypleus tridentatus TaxID=6853 RepID=UPI003FD046AF
MVREESKTWNSYSNVWKDLEPYITVSIEKLEQICQLVNAACATLEPWQIILISVFLTLSAVYMWKLLHPKEGLLRHLKMKLFKFVRCIPSVKKRIATELCKIEQEVSEELKLVYENADFLLDLTEKSWSVDKIIELTKKYTELGNVSWKNGKVSGAVYYGDEQLTSLVTKVYGMTTWSNPLHPDIFPGIRKMEAEVVRMSCNLFNGGPDACGTVTSGGTESILLACKAYRDYAVEVRGIVSPEMVVPLTAHAAFEKASHIMRIKIHFAPVDPTTMQVNIKAMRKLINKNTCMLVGSAPQFPHGVLDPIEDIGKLGTKYNIPVHVDACLGGFLLPFMERAGYQIPLCDFRVPGVTSISADTHKYGYAPKGSSLVMYCHKRYLHYQFSVQTDWPGGIYASPNLGGSRAGGLIAACWASLLFFGKEGYTSKTKQIISTARFLTERLQEIPGIFVYGKPLMSVVAIGSKEFNIYRLSSALTKKGWNLNILQFPKGFHICVTMLHTQNGVAQQFVDDVWQCTEVIMQDPKAAATGTAALYGMSQSIPDRSLVSEIGWIFLDACYSTEVTNDKISS